MPSFSLETSLLELRSPNFHDNWTIQNAVEGLQIFGGIGSGKTSGSGQTFALKFLKAGFGGLVLSAKPGEKEEWQRYCKRTERLDDLIIIEPGGSHFFNFMDYECARDEGSALTGNIVHVLKTVIKASEEKSHGKSEDGFWDTALDMLIGNVIDLCRLAYNTVSIQSIYDIVQSLPRIEEGEQEKKSANKPDTVYDKAFKSAQAKINKLISDFIRGIDSKDVETITNEYIIQNIPEARVFSQLDIFFNSTFRGLSEKTRSIIDFSFSGFLFRLLRDPVFSLFCNKPSTVTPEDCTNGKIILINLPVKIYDKIGRDAQIMFKFIWQRAMERRRIEQNSRPVFLWADEAQNFIHEHDATYQATARSSRICTVYITQNLSNYFANMGGDKSEAKVRSFLGTLNTKIFHANADIETNKYASELIGDHEYEKQTHGSSYATNNISQSKNSSPELKRMIRPESFVRLRTGGKNNDFIVEGYMHCPGKTFSTEHNTIKMAFKQN